MYRARLTQLLLGLAAGFFQPVPAIASGPILTQLPGLQPASPAAPVRVALVIGNARYLGQSGELGNPRSDAVMIAGALHRAGFSKVVVRSDLDARAMHEALDGFGALARIADIALLYYAGHGVARGGTSYLIPTDLTLESELGTKGVTEAMIERVLAPARLLHIVILDACRDRIGNLADTPPAPQSKGVTMYSVALGQEAEDGAAINSPFAVAFARHVMERDLTVQALFERVSADVVRAVHKNPTLTASPDAQRLYLASSAPPSAPTRIDAESAVWQLCPIAPLRDPCDRYIAQYPHGRYLHQAYEHIADIDSIVNAKARRPNLSGDADVPELGIRVRRAPRDDGSIYVIAVADGSPALGTLLAGDVITRINDVPPDADDTPGEVLRKALDEGRQKRIKFLLERGGIASLVVLRVDAEPGGGGL